MKEINLDIGSAGKSGDDRFIGVDYYAPDADVKALMWELPYEDNSVDSIYSAQALEHVSKFQVVPTLQEWHRVLKLGGRLQIQVPDLVWACTHWLTHQTTEWNLDVIYGTQEHEGQFHKTGFNKDILRMYVTLAGGFDIQKLEFFGSTLKDAINSNKGVVQRCINLEAIKKS